MSRVGELNQTEQESSSANLGFDTSDSQTGLWLYLVKVVRKALSRLSQEQIDEIVPDKEQIAADDSENLLEYEATGFSQPDFLEKLDVSHPLLVARKRFNDKYVHKSMAKAPPKRERRSHEIVDIDGVRQQWGQFKRRFEEDRLRQSAQGEEAKNA